MMTIEIERKFLVRDDGWRARAASKHQFRQGYLKADGNFSLRIRVIDGAKAVLAVKLRRRGLSRDEFEYEIPLEEAADLLSRAIGQIIEKTRYTVPHEGSVWEVDEFGGGHSGLILAEIDMSSEDMPLPMPPWVGREITGDSRYSNRSLAGAWPEACHAQVDMPFGRRSGHGWSRQLFRSS